MTGLNATTAGAPVGSMQRKLSAGKFRVVIRPIGDTPTKSEGGALRLVRQGETQRVQIAAHQPLDPRSDNTIPLGLARELSDLFVAKVAQVRKLFEEAGRLPPATDLDHWEAEFPGWDEKAEPVEAPVTRMLLVDLPDDLSCSRSSSRHAGAEPEFGTRSRPSGAGRSQKATRSQELARAAMCSRPARGRQPRSSLAATAGAYYPWPAARRCSICPSSSTTRSWCTQPFSI